MLIFRAWATCGKSRVFSTDPPFLHRRDNSDCRPLHGTWRTLCMNRHLIDKAVGRTQKKSFPLSSFPKAFLCFDFKTNPSSCASKSRQSTSVILQRKLQKSIHHARYGISRMTCWKHYLTAFWQLPLKPIGIARGWEKRVIRTKMTYAKFLASLPSLALCFQPRSRPFVWLLARTWIRKNTDCFAVYLSRWGRLMSTWLL